MALRVGIHENLSVTKVAKNEKGTLTIDVSKGSDGNPIEQLNSSSGSTSFQQETHQFLIFPLKTTAYDGRKFDYKEQMNNIANFIDPLAHIVSMYISKDKIKWDMFKNTGVDNTNIETRILDQTVLDQLYKNIVDQFITMVSPYVGQNSKKLRGVFIRSSKSKHYPALRKKFLDSYPIFEPMEVPASASKIRFSQYEINNGMDVPDKITGAQVVTQDEAKTADTLFAQN